MSELRYQSGFGNHHSTEAKPGALPADKNNPQKAPYGLYAEQLTGSAFTALRHENLRSWLYRALPSVKHGPYQKINSGDFKSGPAPEPTSPVQRRWDPIAEPSSPTDFLDGCKTYVVTGNPTSMQGSAVHLYSANQSMARFFYNSDGEMLIVPFDGVLHLKTEFGQLNVEPLEIAVVPRGVKFKVDLPGKTARGYVCENYGLPFQLPGLGPIGANGLANPRHFQYPVASFEKDSGPCEIIAKQCGALWSYESASTPLDVVAWYGNYAPYKYDLRLFNTIGTVSFDHPDPSIFTVITAPSGHPGVANVEFVIFPPRWLVGEDTFRPPYYHRNIMSEFMGLVTGEYDAKNAGGFEPGGGSLHNCMSGHGPEAAVFEKASNSELKPHKLDKTMALMFESRYPFSTTSFSESNYLQKNYLECWTGLKRSTEI